MNPFNQQVFRDLHHTNEIIRVLINKMARTNGHLDEVDKSSLRTASARMKVYARNNPIEWKMFQQRDKNPPQ